MTTVGIVSPGAMGSALGRAWLAGGARVVATTAGRSDRTRGLADSLELLPDLASVVRSSDVVVSVCPPDQASAVLEDLLAQTETPSLVADLNAVSPRLVRALAATAEAAGTRLLDGAISGGPPRPGGDTMLYLSGPDAQALADLPAEGLRTRVVGDTVGSASAVKMCTASVYKGTTAIWIQALQAAEAHGVLQVVLDDLAEVFPDRVSAAGRTIASAASKSDRFVGEMDFIAETQGAVGLSPELFAGMAAVYGRLSRTPAARLTPEEAAAVTDLEAMLRRLR